MTNAYQTQWLLTNEEFSRLIHGLEDFLATDYSSRCLDDDDDRMRVAAGVAAWMISDKVVAVSPDKLLPKAKYHLGFNVVDESTGKHIIQLVLDRTPEMADGDFLQLQNFFWSTIGRAIRDNPELIRTLELGGVKVRIDLSGDMGGQQAAL